MGTVIDFALKPASSGADSTPRSAQEGELFLIQEGLDLLANYRSIPDRDLRLAISRLVEAAAGGKRSIQVPF